METKPKKYKMLKSISGVREGDIQPTNFRKGETHELDESLAEQFYHQGAIDEVGANAKVSDPEDREKKVTGPTETKLQETRPGEGQAGIKPESMGIEELVAFARDHHGLDVNSRMGREDVIAAIEAKEAKAKQPTKTKK